MHLRTLLIVGSLLFCLAGRATDVLAPDSLQTGRIVSDTIYAEDLLEEIEEDYWLLELLKEQGRSIASREDSILMARMENDTTTAFPFHIGVRDSLLILHRAQKMPYHPLTLPLYFVVPKIKSLSDTTQEAFSVYTIRNKARTYLTAHHADLYVNMYDSIEYHLPSALETRHDIALETKALVYDPEEDAIERMQALRNQYSPWRREATVMLQLTQNYVSKNWYAGGNSNFAVLGIAKGFYNYDNKKNFTWENSAEWRIGLNTVDGDTLRKVNMNEDIFKIYTKAGLKAFGKFSYSLSADFQTHFCHTWKENERVAKTAPFTPIRLNLALGLDYKPLDGLSIVLSPINYKLVHVSDTTDLSATSFGVEEGKKTLNDLGSSLRVDWVWKPVREISLNTKFYLYTNYKRVEVDLEMACDFIINRYFSARLMLHPRYDNTVILENDAKAKIQFKELLSIGFAHKFR